MIFAEAKNENSFQMKSKILYPIFISLVAFFIVSCSHPGDEFALSTEQAVDALLTSDQVVLPAQILDQENADFVLVDVRSPAEYAAGHPQNAINVPSRDILEPQYLELWDKAETTYYLLGNTQLEANTPWMVLVQLGYTNIRVLQGGIAYLANPSDTTGLNLEDEAARYDYAAIFSKAIENAEKTIAPAPKPVVVKNRPKVVVPKPRPKPAPVEEEEEEGC